MISLTIAGSDSGGGAGIQADIKTFQELGVFGTTVITALTDQNTKGVHGVFKVTPQFVQQQLSSVLEDFSIKSIKTGMLYSAEIIEAAAAVLREQKIPLVLDPVMIAKGGEKLLQNSAVEALIEQLLPLTTICTPNIPEAEVLTGMSIKDSKDMERAARSILQMGSDWVVIKGGHTGEKDAVDRVYGHDAAFTMTTPRKKTDHTHGTGCTFSAAITADLAKGYTIPEAIIEAKKFVHLAISHPLFIGSGKGPTNHFAFNQQKGVCEVVVNEA